MTTKNRNRFPADWDEHRVRDVLEYYESQTDEEAVAEHEAALSGLALSPSETSPENHETS